MSKKSRRNRVRRPETDKQLPVKSDPKLPSNTIGDDQSKTVSVTHQRTVTESFSGPLPPPSVLKQYEAILPGAATRILAQAKQQTDHRIAMEKKVTHWDIIRSFTGLAVGVIVALACILCGSGLVYSGHDVAGATIATGCVVSLVAVFVYGSRMRKDERVEKAKIMTGRE